jgi:hypothetical protein
MSLVRLTGYNLGVLNGWGSTFVVVQRGFNEVYKYLLHTRRSFQRAKIDEPGFQVKVIM